MSQGLQENKTEKPNNNKYTHWQMHPSLRLPLPNSGALDRMVLAPLSQARSPLLGLAPDLLPFLGGQSHIHSLKDPIQGWLPAQAIPLSSRLTGPTACQPPTPGCVEGQALQNQHVPDEIHNLTHPLTHTHSRSSASKDCGFISSVQYGV